MPEGAGPLALAGGMAALAVAVYFLVSAVQLTRASERTLRQLALAARAPAPQGPGPRFVLILPMLREESVAAHAMRQFLPAIRRGLPIDVVVATTAREREEREQALAALRARLAGGSWREVEPVAAVALDAEGVRALEARAAAGGFGDTDELLRRHLRPDTATVVRALAQELNAQAGREAFFHVEAPAQAQGKVGQMNTAVAFWNALPGRRAEPENVYFGVYDADSSPDPRVFDAVLRTMEERDRAGAPRPGILQQVSCFCQNVHELRGGMGALRLADALAQTRWALGFEYPLYAGYSRAVRGGGLRRLVYCVGHGCYVSQAVLERAGGFPTCSPTDDLALGYLASVAGMEVCPIPVLDFCDVAPNPFSTIRQSRFWYRGSARYHRDMRVFRRQLGVSPGLAQWWLLVADGRMRAFFWAWRSALWVGAAVFALATGTWGLLALLVVGHLLYVQAGFLHVLGALRRIPGAADHLRLPRLSPGRVALGLAAASVMFVVRGIGPMTASLGFKPPRPAGVAWKIER